MLSQPVLETARLRLCPFAPTDATQIRVLAGERRIADMTLNIPHPYPAGVAEEWIDNHSRALETSQAIHYAVIRKKDGVLVGAVALLNIDRAAARAEIGYWIGMPLWNRGFATKAATSLVAFGFEHLQLHRVHAHCFPRSKASGRVLSKLEMRTEGCLREHVSNGGEHEDMLQYGILRTDRRMRGVQWEEGR